MAKYQWLNNKQLQPWYCVEIITEGDSKVVYFHSKIHMNKVKKLNPSFSTAFTDQEILNDFDIIGRIHEMYGTDIYRTY